MATILIIDDDPIFGTVLEDRFRVAGHEATLTNDSTHALTRTLEAPVDLLVLEAKPPDGHEVEALRALRGQKATRHLPVLVLSDSAESQHRVAALRAGADDYLTKPCDLEEVLIRAERLMERRATDSTLLQGDLASHPLWELVQYLQHVGKSGELVLRGSTTTGRVLFARGAPVAARWGDLPPAEALLAVLGLNQGRFQMTSEVSDPSLEAGKALSAHEVMLEAALLQDELDKRRAFLPASGTPLEIGERDGPPEPPEELVNLPLVEIHRRVAERPGTRIFDLMSDLPLAPQKIRLAVAFLVENEWLATPVDASFSFPNTTELASIQLTEMAITEYLSAAKSAGFGTSALPFVILVEESHWPELLERVKSIPGFSRHRELQRFEEELRTKKQGSIGFLAEPGKLMLHARLLDAAEAATIEAMATVSVGVFIWLDLGEAAELVQRIVARVETVRSPARGLLAASSPEGQKLAEDVVKDTHRWRTSPHVPASLLGVFRLLQPVPG